MNIFTSTVGVCAILNANLSLGQRDNFSAPTNKPAVQRNHKDNDDVISRNETSCIAPVELQQFKFASV